MRLSCCHGQKYGIEKADSLIGILQTEKSDIGRVKLLLQRAEDYLLKAKAMALEADLIDNLGLNTSRLELRVTETESTLDISLIDNSNGYIPDKIIKGDELQTMKKRMEDIGAVYHLFSLPENGCHVSLQLNSPNAVF